MSVTFFDGFDDRNSSDDGGAWIGSAACGSAFARNGVGQGVQINNNTIRKVFTSAQAGAVMTVGFAYRDSNPGFNGGNGFNFRYQDGFGSVGTGLAVVVTNTGALSAFRPHGSVLFGTSDSGVILANTWHYIEISVGISSYNANNSPVVADATVTVKVDGVQVIHNTACQTRIWNNFEIAGNVWSEFFITSYSNSYVDDFHASNVREFLGDVIVRRLVPVADGTNGVALTPSTGANWQTVDEKPARSGGSGSITTTAPDASDYNSSNTDGATDLFTMETLTVAEGSAILAVQVTAAVLTDESGTKGVKLVAQIADGGTAVTSDRYPVVNSLVKRTKVWETDPDGGAWTVAGVNGCEFGVKVVD